MRLDRQLALEGLVRSRTAAKAAIDEGRVLVNGRPATRSSQQVGDDDRVELVAEDPWVSRAAHKLLGALAGSGLAVPARVLDAGASTGGFTQVCLALGAEIVYAVDVGHGQLASQIAAEPRVVVRERTNLRELTLDHLDGLPVDLVVADVSFISLSLLVGPLATVLRDGGTALLLVKPQFEVGRGGLDDHGVVGDQRRRVAAVEAVVAAARSVGLRQFWRGDSELPGEHGNRETFVALRKEH